MQAEAAAAVATQASMTPTTDQYHALIAKQADLIARLKLELDIEHTRVKHLRSELADLRQQVMQQHATLEVEEEQIANRLLKHIRDLKKEKSEIMVAMEQEEEMITNKLGKRLTELEREKTALERQLVGGTGPVDANANVEVAHEAMTESFAKMNSK